MSKPELHGRDHRPGGADPIPGLQGVQYAYAAAIGSTIPFGTTTYWDLAGGASGTPPITDSTDVYGYDTFTAGPQTGMGGVLVKTQGLYHITTVLQVLTEELSATVHQRGMQFLFEGSAYHVLAGYQTGSKNSMVLGYQASSVLLAVGPGELLVGIATANNDGAGSPGAFAFIEIERKDRRDWSALSAPP